MTSYADCPDERFRIEWRSAQDYERRDALGEQGHHPKLETPAESALLFYLLFWAKVADDL